MGFKRDINTILCYIDLSETGNDYLFSRGEIHKRFSEEVSCVLQNYGLDCVIQPLGGKGGGAETLSEALKFLWAEKEEAWIVILFKMAIATKRHVLQILTKTTFNQRPKAIIDFGIKTEEDFINRNLDFQLGCRLATLKFLSDEVCKKLLRKYPTFRFDQSFNLHIKPLRFSVTYSLDSELQNKLNSLRLIRLFNNLRIRTGFYSTYRFTKWLFISRFDGELKIADKTRIRKPYRQHYLLFSTNILSDYFSSKQVSAGE